YEVRVVAGDSPSNVGSEGHAASAPSPGSDKPIQLTHNQAVENHIRWANDGRHIFFTVEIGDVSGPYRDLQPHLYWVDSETGTVEQWSKDFVGSVEHYAVAGDNVLTCARVGTEVQIYSAGRASDPQRPAAHWNGTYATISAAAHSSRIVFV